MGNLVTLSGPVRGLHCRPNGDDDAPLIAADPSRPRHLVALYLADNARLAVAATSRDAGKTWRRRPVAADTACTGGASDAALGDLGLLVDTAGRAIASFGWINANPPPTAINHDVIHELTSRTTGPHAAWSSSPTEVDRSQPDQRGYLTQVGSRVYLETERFYGTGLTSVPGLGAIDVVRTTNHGRSWEPAAGQPPSFVPGHQAVAAGIEQAHGALVAIWVDVDLVANSPALVGSVLGRGEGVLVGTIRSSRSVDGGRSWSPAVDVATCTQCLLPRTASARDGSVLVSYEDQGSPGGVELARSTDGGVTWTVHKVAPASRVQYAPTAVTADDSTIAVLHEHTVPGPGQRYVVELSTSTDFGRTWTRTTLSPVMNVKTYTDPAFDSALGAMDGVAAIPGGFVAAFTTFRPGPVSDGQDDVATVRVMRRSEPPS